MKKWIGTLLITGLTSASLYAGCNTKACTDVSVERLYLTADGTLYVGTSGDEKALDCAKGAGNGGIENKYVSLHEEDTGKNGMFSLLLTAKATGKKVMIRIEEGSKDCHVLYVTLD